ncbi:hypothetical protein BSZ40_07575 [Buchananella hordeovulneris]|uniref:Uncharacterized protein n=2 Tax=Buchananella hordeovulneris TaxID=52770 RepID=A0A1Q5PV26_9ACTO|nr:hypothetical protein BSZ40_07575 [Buchananella hordeovulneris]
MDLMLSVLASVDGTVILGSATAQDLGDFLAQRGVVAQLEWFDDTPNLVQVRLAEMAGGVVLGTPQGLQAGPSVEELAQEIAAQLPADVLFGETAVDSLPADFELELPSEKTEGKEVRTLVFVTFPVHHIPLEAQSLQRTMAVREVEGGAFVVTAGPDWWVPFLPVPKDAGPVVALQRASVGDANLTIVDDSAPENWVIHDWALRTRFVTGELPLVDGKVADPQILANLTQTFALRDEVGAVAGFLPLACPHALGEALAKRGDDGFLALLDAMDVPTDLGRFVMGEGKLEALDDVVIHEPRGVTNAIGRSVKMWMEEEGDKPDWWETYETVVEERPEVVRLAAAAEAAVGAALVARACLGRKSVGRRVLLGTGGALLLFDALAEIAFARLLRRKS